MSLNYTTGNPSNLTAGATASMNDIAGPLTDIKTFLTDGSAAVGDTILASPTSPAWRTVLDTQGNMANLTAGVFFFNNAGIASLSGSGASGIATLWVPPSAGDVAVAGKTTRLRLRIPWIVNATNSGINATWSLYPITSVVGGIGAITPTLGTAIAGSGVNAPTLNASTAGVATGASFDLSAVTGSGTGAYCLGVNGSGAMAGNSQIACQLLLEMRHT